MATNPVARSLGETRIQHARVLDVDIGSFSLTVATEFSKKPLSGISYAVPYLHFNNGEGINFVPEVGSLCWLCEPSDGSRPFVISWAPAQDEGDFRSRRMDMNPGDICLSTRDENYVILRRGGVVQIGGGPLCQRIYMPVNNTITDFCENYSLQTLGGALEWTVEREDTTTDGARPTTLKLKAKHKASDKNPIAQLEIGSHDDSTILSLAIKASGDDGAQTQISLTMNKEGDVKWAIKKDVEWKVDGKYTIEAIQDISIKSTTGKVALEGTTEFSAKGLIAKLEADTEATMKGGVSVNIDAPVITLGGLGATSPAAKGDMLVSWLASHTHMDTVLLTPSTPPLQAGALTGILSTTVRVK